MSACTHAHVRKGKMRQCCLQKYDKYFQKSDLKENIFIQGVGGHEWSNFWNSEFGCSTENSSVVETVLQALRKRVSTARCCLHLRHACFNYEDPFWCMSFWQMVTDPDIRAVILNLNALVSLGSSVLITSKGDSVVLFCVFSSFIQRLQPVDGASLYSKLVGFWSRNWLFETVGCRSLTGFCDLCRLCQSSRRSAYLLIQPWICCPEIGLVGWKLLKIGECGGWHW